MLQRQLLILLVSLSVLVTGCKPTPDVAPKVAAPIRIGASFWPGQYWADIANKKGWFKEAGLNVEMVDTNADYFASFEQVVNGKLDVVAFTLFDLTLYRARGKDVVGFLASDYSNGADALVARPGISTVRELAGKKIGLSQGTYLEYIWTILLERNDLKPDAVQIVEMSAEKGAGELSSGRVDAIFTWEPFVADALAKTGGEKLFDSSQIPGISWTIYATRGDFLRQRSSEIQKLMQVWKRTEEYIQKEPNEAYTIVAEVNHTTVAEVLAFAQLDKTLGPNENRAAFSYAGGFDSLHGSARRMNDFQIQAGLANNQIESPKLLDSSFIHELTRSDFPASMTQ